MREAAVAAVRAGDYGLARRLLDVLSATPPMATPVPPVVELAAHKAKRGQP